MTSKQIKELINEKLESAKADLLNTLIFEDREYIKGEIDTYRDLLICIEQQEIKEAIENE